MGKHNYLSRVFNGENVSREKTGFSAKPNEEKYRVVAVESRVAGQNYLFAICVVRSRRKTATISAHDRPTRSSGPTAFLALRDYRRCTSAGIFIVSK